MKALIIILIVPFLSVAKDKKCFSRDKDPDHVATCKGLNAFDCGAHKEICDWGVQVGCYLRGDVLASDNSMCDDKNLQECGKQSFYCEWRGADDPPRPRNQVVGTPAAIGAPAVVVIEKKKKPKPKKAASSSSAAPQPPPAKMLPLPKPSK